MAELYSATDIAKKIGVTPETIKNWEQMGYIPQAARVGLKKKRVWNEWKLQRILDFARDNGYSIPSRGILFGGHNG